MREGWGVGRAGRDDEWKKILICIEDFGNFDEARGTKTSITLLDRRGASATLKKNKLITKIIS